MPVTLFDLITSPFGIGSVGDTLWSGAELTAVSDSVVFNNATPGSLAPGDTTTSGGVTFTVTSVNQMNVTIDHVGGSSPASVNAIEFTDGSTTYTAYVPKDLSDYVDISSITINGIVNVPSIDTSSMDDDDPVTLKEQCLLYDFIQLSDVPGVGQTMTTASGELVEVDEPLLFETVSSDSILPGDTTLIDGVTWTVSSFATSSATVVESGTSSSVNGYVMQLENSAGDTLEYFVPFDLPGQSDPNAGDGLVDIESITFDTLTLAEGAKKSAIDDDDNVTLICFARGTRIETDRGEVEVQDLKEGDMVRTADDGMQPIRWIGSQSVEAKGKFAPITLRAGSFGNRRDLRVSPQHRMLIGDFRAQIFFGEEEVLVPAKGLLNHDGVFSEEGGEVEYFHILFDQHQIIFAEGIKTESFHPGEASMSGIDDAARDEILELFPDLSDAAPTYPKAARASVKAHEGLVIGTRTLLG